MNKVYYILFFILLTSCNSKNFIYSQSKDSFLGSASVKPHKIGELNIGMPIDEIEKVYPELKVVSYIEDFNGLENLSYLVKNATNETVLKILPYETEEKKLDKRIRRIEVLSNKLKTDTEIGIGSTYADINEHYYIDFTFVDHLGHVIATDEKVGISFELETANLQSINENTKISKIHLFENIKAPFTKRTR